MKAQTKKPEFVQSKTKIFVIDDDENLLDAMRGFFDMHKNSLPEYHLFSDVDEFFEAMNPDVNICVIDYYLHHITGLELIQKVVKTNPQCWFIMFSGQTRLSVAAEFMNHSYGSRYVEKGKNDSMDKLLFYIRDIMSRIKTLENYFYESFKNKRSLSELNDSLTDLKDSI